MPKEIAIRIKPEFAFDEKAIEDEISRSSGIPKPFRFRLKKRSLDARKRIEYLIQVDVFSEEEEIPEFQDAFKPGNVQNAKEIAVIGAGPAGLFAALELIQLGFKPVVFERGKDVRARRRDLAKLNKEHVVNPDSNYCFGEGGAGCFSDGKLYTRSKKRGSVQKSLSILVQFGADQDILVDAHPHIGTNKLPQIITKIREEIIQCGGEVRFDSKLTDILVEGNKVKGIEINQSEKHRFEHLILATGHSARDIFELLQRKKIEMQFQVFGLGVRVEHPQTLIDQIQYRSKERGYYLPPASYSLVEQVDGIGVYSFCMCPGGVIAPCATSAGEIVTNGWSPSKRNNPYANSGMVVSVVEEKLRNKSVLKGLEFQKEIEQKAWATAGKSQKAPAQRMTDFMQKRFSTSLPSSSYFPGLSSVQLSEILPTFILDRLQKGFKAFDKKMNGFISEEAVVVGVESRTSSPLRIPRKKDRLEHTQIQGLYPCGEGAGYAGGIISAAIDGMRCAEQIAKSINEYGIE